MSAYDPRPQAVTVADPVVRSSARQSGAKRRIYMRTFGCQMNFYDSQKMVDLMQPWGFEMTDNPQDADLAILNTCHIREKASEKVYSDLGRLNTIKQERQQAGQAMVIAVTGCVAQAEGEEMIRRAQYVDVVLGPQSYHQLPEMVATALRVQATQGEGHGGKKRAGVGLLNTDFPVESKFDYLPESQMPAGVSAFLSVQEGCDKFCTYCVVPYTRGAEYSRPAESVIREAKQLVAKGARELVLLGQNVNAYHGASPTGQGTYSLAALIHELANIEGLKRIRYTTSHPTDMQTDLMQAHRDVPQLMPYLHLPIQAGSDAVLKKMNRKYTVAQYMEIIDQLRSYQPQLALSSDFIVGFPGERDVDFYGTLDVVKQVGYPQAYSFKYSPRPGTPSAIYDQMVPEDVKDQRLQALQALLRQQQIAFNESCIGQSVPILIESFSERSGRLYGRSPFMQSVYVDGGQESDIGTEIMVQITEGHDNSLTGVKT